MKLPLSWLSDYTDMTGITPKEYDAKLTMSGSKVEEVYYLGAEIENVVTGKILEVVDHPDSDHLKICQLDVGNPRPHRSPDLSLRGGAADVAISQNMVK